MMDYKEMILKSLLTIAIFVDISGVCHANPVSRDMRLVVVSNGVAILPCSVPDGDLPVEYRWEKDSVPVIPPDDGRIQITDEGHLLLKDAAQEDSGLYVCTATARNQITVVNVTLIVLDSDEAPQFVNFSQPNATIWRFVDSSVKFRCPVKGQPNPTITWIKDDMHIDTTLVDSTTEIKDWSITLRNLKVPDSGNYTCFVANKLGSVNATFVLQVNPKDKNLLNSSRPDLSVFHPLNTTVKYGSSATFQCRVRSEAPPNIQWLKKVEDSDIPRMKKEHHDLIKVQGENYRVLQSSEVVERSDGSFLNKLTIPEVYEGDSGKYICLGANSMGYSFRSAYLTVMPRPRALPLGWSRSVVVHPGHPGSLLVAIPITLGVVVGVMVALVVLCHRRRLDTTVALPANGYLNEDIKRTTSKAAVTVTNNCNEDGLESYSGDELEEAKEDGLGPNSTMQSEVELGGSGKAVTKICGDPNSIVNYDSCFAMRHEV